MSDKFASCIHCGERLTADGFAMCGHDQDVRSKRAPLYFRWKGGYTKRYHGLRTLVEDTVGHHSYNVAQTLRHIAGELPRERQHILLEAALDHDVAEHIVGDMPAPTKRNIPGLRDLFAEYEMKVMAENGLDCAEDQLEPLEKVLLKCADSLDGMRFCLQERQMGNRLAHSIYKAFESYVTTLLVDNASEPLMRRAQGLFQHIVNEWRIADDS